MFAEEHLWRFERGWPSACGQLPAASCGKPGAPTVSRKIILRECASPWVLEFSGYAGARIDACLLITLGIASAHVLFLGFPKGSSCLSHTRTCKLKNTLSILFQVYAAVSENEGPLFGSPSNKDPNILGSVITPLIFGNSHVPLN